MGLQDSPTVFRGTLRYRGFCERMYAAAQCGLLEVGPVAQLEQVKGDSQLSRRKWLAALLEVSEADLEGAVQQRIQGGLGADVGLSFLEWLGLLSDLPMPDAPVENPVDVMTALLKREECLYQKDERDMVAMYHELVVELKNGSFERRTATLIEYGDIQGESAMARTVGVTAGIAAKLLLDATASSGGAYSGQFGYGVQRPLSREWYDPCLDLLSAEGIRLVERVAPAKSEGADAL